MAEQTKVELTKSKLDMYGVQVTVTVHIGDWVKRVAISPIDYSTFKKWNEIYSDKVHESIVKQIEHELTTPKEGKS